MFFKEEDYFLNAVIAAFHNKTSILHLPNSIFIINSIAFCPS